MSLPHIMLHTKVGASLKVCRLSPAERWAWAGGVLCIAGEADVRGTLTIADGIPATAEDVARKADVPLSVARSALGKLREFRMLDPDEHGVEWVHDWDEHQPKPKRDTTAAERKRRQRNRDRHAPVTPVVTRDSHGVTPPEVEVEVRTTPPDPPAGGNRRRDRDEYEQQLTAWSASIVPEADESYRLAGVRHALSVIEGQHKQPTAQGVRWYAAHGSVNAFGLDDEARAAIRREFEAVGVVHQALTVAQQINDRADAQNGAAA